MTERQIIYLICGLVIVAGLGAIAYETVLKPGPADVVINPATISSQVRQAVNERIDYLPEVTCDPDTTVQVGDHVQCDVFVHGRVYRNSATILDSLGAFRVDPLRLGGEIQRADAAAAQQAADAAAASRREAAANRAYARRSYRESVASCRSNQIPGPDRAWELKQCLVVARQMYGG